MKRQAPALPALTDETQSRIRAALHTQYVWAKTRRLQAGGLPESKANRRVYDRALSEEAAANAACKAFGRAYP